MNTNKINWTVRFKNKLWVSSFISQTLLLIQAIILGLDSLHAIHVNIEALDAWVKWLLGILNAVLAYLTYLGIVQDPTVEGVGDSARTLSRQEPLPKENKTTPYL
ncbi:phi LC3 family holin [Priestia megaterium]|uniref:phage holin n=1 Tax=Priestia megaterium TaxID=1404 RepID=UPI0033982E26